MKYLFLAAAMVAASACDAFVYEISAMFEVTSTDDQRVSLGQTFEGTFRYEADTVDGTFYSLWPSGPIAGENMSFDGIVNMPSVFLDGVDFGFGYTYPSGHAYLTVEAGAVTQLVWFATYGPWYWDMFGTSFATRDSIYDILFEGSAGGTSVGSVQFSEPYRIFELPILVPDVASTWVLFGLGIAAMMVLGRRGDRSGLRRG